MLCGCGPSRRKTWLQTSIKAFCNTSVRLDECCVVAGVVRPKEERARPMQALALRFPAARRLAPQARRDALCQLARLASVHASRGSALCSG